MHPYVIAQAARLFITTAQTEDFTNFLTEWSALLLKYTDPTLHTPIVVRDINELYERFHAFVIALRQQVKHGKGYTLTGDDYANMFIHEDAEHRARIPAPTDTPTPQVSNQKHLVTRISGNEQDPGVNHIGLPTDVAKLGYALIYTAQDAEMPPVETFVTQEASGHNRFDIHSELAQVGMRCWMVAWYENHIGQRGPVSNPISFIVI